MAARWKCCKCEAIHHFLPKKCCRCGCRKVTRKLTCPKCDKTIAYSRVASHFEGETLTAKANVNRKRLFCLSCDAVIEAALVCDFELKVVG